MSDATNDIYETVEFKGKKYHIEAHIIIQMLKKFRHDDKQKI
jgi:hypothetical protein